MKSLKDIFKQQEINMFFTLWRDYKKLLMPYLPTNMFAIHDLLIDKHRKTSGR